MLPFLVLIIALQVNGQKEIKITGVVVDKKTQESLPFASIVYQAKSIGTISDMNGHFDLMLTYAEPSDSLTISFVGYETFKTTIEKCTQPNKFELKPSINTLKEVIVSETSKEFNLEKYMAEVVKDYNKNKRKDAHIALAHYREKAIEDTKYIMYMESIGYSVFAPKRANAALFSNYNFFYENTRCYVENPKWMKYKENMRNPNQENVLPGGGSNLNLFRNFEELGILSKKNYKKYNFKVDSLYYVGDNLIRSISFKGPISEGSIHVFANTKQILKIDCSTNKYWGTAFHQRIDAEVKILFNYFGETPFIKSISANYEREGLKYSNSLTVLIQKFNEFKLNSEEYWSFSSSNPYIEYIPEAWEAGSITADEDYNEIAADLSSNSTLLEKAFKEFSGRWFFTNQNHNETGISKIKQLKQHF